MDKAAAQTPKEQKSKRLAIIALLASAFLASPLHAQITINLSPDQAAVDVTQSQDFTAVVTGTSNKTIKWKLCNGKGKSCVLGGNSEVGTIVDIGVDAEGNHMGRYTAPDVLPPPPTTCKLVVGGCQVVLKAKLVGQRKTNARATVRINYPTPPPESFRLWSVRTDSGVGDIVYDPVRRLVFAAIPGLNQVGVFSAETKERVATISVPLPAGLDLTPDGSRLLVGTSLEALYVIDPSTAQVTDRILAPTDENPGLTKVEGFVTTSNGTVLLLARGSDGAGLFQWNPGTGGFQPRDPGIGGASSMARSQDHSKVFLAHVGGLGSPSLFTVYEAATDTFSVYGTGPSLVRSPVINHDGTQFAYLSGTTLVFLDQQLQHVATLAVPSSEWVLYSADGRYLYVAETGPDRLLVIDTETFSVIGHIPSINTTGTSGTGTRLRAIDETSTIFGTSGRSLSFIDARNPVVLPDEAVFFFRVDPPQGKAGEATRVTVAGANFQQGAQVYFGESPGANAFANSSSTISVKAPPALPGTANVLVSLPNGWQTLAADQFSYGPTVLHVTPSAGSPEGGTEVRIMGYGFDFPLADIEVTFGGQRAKVLELTTYPVSPYAFRLLILKVKTRAGVPGPADLVLNTPAGSTTVENAFHYLTEAAVYPRAGPLGQVIYDRARQRLYISNKGTDQGDVFALNLRQFLTPLPAGADPQGLALTQDGSRLVVANIGDGTVSVDDPDNPSVTFTVPIVTPGSGPWPAAVATTSTGKAFIAVDGSGGGLWELDLSTMTVSRRTDAALLAPRTQLKSSADGTKVFVVSGWISIWDALSNTFYTRALSFSVSDAAPSADGESIAIGAAPNLGVLDGSLHLRTAPRSLDILTRDFFPVQGLEFHPSGSLLYAPLRRGNVSPGEAGILIYDANQGTLRQWVGLPEDFAQNPPAFIPATWDYLAIDETGRRIFVLSESGLTILELDSVPLSIASVAPSDGSSSGGTTLTIRGSGFQIGAVVRFANVEVAASFLDENTLQVTTPSPPPGAGRVTVVNPDGEEYYLDAAFRFLP